MSAASIPCHWMSREELRWAGNAVLAAGGVVVEVNDPQDRSRRYLAVGEWPNGTPIGDGGPVSPKLAAWAIAQELIYGLGFQGVNVYVLDDEHNRARALLALEMLDPEAKRAVQEYRENPALEKMHELRAWIDQRYQRS